MYLALGDFFATILDGDFGDASVDAVFTGSKTEWIFGSVTGIYI